MPSAIQHPALVSLAVLLLTRVVPLPKQPARCCSKGFIDTSATLPPEFVAVGNGDILLPPAVAPRAAAASAATSPQAIPRRILATLKRRTVPLGVACALATWLKLNPEYELRIYDDDALDEWMLRHTDGSARAAVEVLADRLRRSGQAALLGVIKADLWRLMILRAEGGVYIDVDLVAYRPLRDWIRGGDVALELVDTNGKLHQDIIASAPNTCHLNASVALVLGNLRAAAGGRGPLRAPLLDGEGRLRGLGRALPWDEHSAKFVEQLSGPVAFHRALMGCAEAGALDRGVRFLADRCGQCLFTSHYHGYYEVDSLRIGHWTHHIGSWSKSVAGVLYG